MKCIVDTQLPPRLSHFLNERHIDSTHTSGYEKAQYLSDKEIREIAVSEDRIIITKDSDFFDFYMVKSFPPKVLLLQLGNISNRDLLDYFRKNIAMISAEFDKKDVGLLVCSIDKIAVF